MKKIILFIFLMISCQLANADVIAISALPQDNSPTTDDLMVTVDNPGGTKANRKVTLSALRSLMLLGDGSNLTGLTKSQVGLSNVPNPVLPSDATKYLDGTGVYSTPSNAAAGGFTDDGTIVHTTTNTDNVGIGTSTTPAKLTVAGTLTVSGAITGNLTGNVTGTVTGNASTATALAANGANCTAPTAPLGVDASGVAESCTTFVRPTDIDTSGEIANLLSDETGSGSIVFSASPRFTGNVGIASTAPGAALDVIGTVRATTFTGDGAGLTGVGGWTHSGTKIYNTTITDNVGIGTSLPTSLLDVGTAHAFGVDTSGILTLNGGATPSLSTFGQLTTDNNFWAASHGAPVFYDGTAAVALIGAQASDTPSDGQVPKWHTGGTITWDNDNNASGITVADTLILYSDGANNPVGDADLTWNKTTNVLTVGSLATASSNTPKVEYFPTQTSDTHFVSGVNGDGGNDNDDPFVISEGSTLGTNNRVTIVPGGNVGVGTDTPQGKLVVTGGNVGIGTISPVFPLQIVGNVGIGTTTVNSTPYDLNVNNVVTFNKEFTYASNIGIGTTTINWNNGNYQNVGIGTSQGAYVAFTHPTNGNVGKLQLRIKQDATGSRIVSFWPATVLWAGGSAPTLTTGAGNADLINCFWNGTSDYCTSTLNF